MMLFGIMQGRLLPPENGRFQCFPREHWREEFALARAAGLDAIEWIYDLYGADVNPLKTDVGIAELKGLAEQYKVAVKSVCADYFMDRPFTESISNRRHSEFSELVAHLEWLLGQCRIAGITRLVLPFVDHSRIATGEEFESIVDMLRKLAASAEKAAVEIHLETSFPPKQFSDFLSSLPHPMLKVNYDSGNSASLGYDVREELAAYGSRIGSVHIKDRMRGGGTVPLGTGNADFFGLFTGLLALNYRGDYILQVARDVPGKEVSWAQQNLMFLRRQLNSTSDVAHKQEC